MHKGGGCGNGIEEMNVMWTRAEVEVSGLMCLLNREVWEKQRESPRCPLWYHLRRCHPKVMLDVDLNLSSVLSYWPEGVAFSIFWMTHLLGTHSLNFCLLGNVLVSPSFLKDSFPGYGILGSHANFYLVLFKNTFHLFVDLHLVKCCSLMDLSFFGYT